MSKADTIRAEVTRIKNAADLAALDALYVEVVGYSIAEDDPTETAEGVRGILLDYQREVCFSLGVHCSDVGL